MEDSILLLFCARTARDNAILRHIEGLPGFDVAYDRGINFGIVKDADLFV